VVVEIAGGRKCWFYIHFEGGPGTGVAGGVVKHVNVLATQSSQPPGRATHQNLPTLTFYNSTFIKDI